MYINIHTLQVTQNGLRNTPQLKNMVEFVKRGGYFNNSALTAFHVTGQRNDKPSLMHIADIEGQLFIHDGHHRAMAILMGGRSLVDESEFKIFQYSWEEYIKPNLEKKWYTPFDPRVESRLADLTRFKKMMHCCDEFEELQLFAIKNFAHYYKTERKFTWLYEMEKDESISQYRMS